MCPINFLIEKVCATAVETGVLNPGQPANLVGMFAGSKLTPSTPTDKPEPESLSFVEDSLDLNAIIFLLKVSRRVYPENCVIKNGEVPCRLLRLPLLI